VSPFSQNAENKKGGGYPYPPIFQWGSLNHFLVEKKIKKKEFQNPSPCRIEDKPKNAPRYTPEN